ncbi:hypothetical protein N802_16760 [Knoellia sinensis KCTC 19936]|uniref:Uncharacterized protein n=1 Tax=Knoellia sinensis KCTC 19936 TaxID=1385520 RepID=A0A0A0J637_9MICO|nr:hypothetical protein [Knoellia sinensis]KGN32678.1 hypothetical protein N802_16760 [Knoellia sinensis KCTC 19936]
MTRLADPLLSLSIKILPSPVRRRYVAEFEADLESLPRTKQLGYAVSTLFGAPHLRWEVLSSQAGSGAAFCYVGRHHDRRIHTGSADPTVFALECTRCGRIRDPKQRDQRTDQGGIARTTFGGV